MSAEVAPRITGTETEWGISFLPFASDANPTPNFVPMEARYINEVVKNYLLPYIPHIGPLTNNFLSNGSRLYMDSGEHLESSTAEDSSFMGTGANEIASERLLFAAFARAKQAGFLRDFAINKRVVDDYGSTWGVPRKLLRASQCGPNKPGKTSAAGRAPCDTECFLWSGILR